METLLIKAPESVALKLGGFLRRYFNVKFAPTNAQVCSIDLIFYGTFGERKQQNICNFLATEKLGDILQMFWFKYRVLFPREPIGKGYFK